MARAAAVAFDEAEADAARADLERKGAVERATRLARSAMTRRDTCAALAAWDQVLRFEPYNREAVQQREKALALKQRPAPRMC